MDLKSIISRKAHETSVKSLQNVPPTLQEYLTLEFMNSIASSLTAITKDRFNYTGKIQQERDALRITFTSSSQTDTIDLIIAYETGGMKFVNINQKLEKTLDGVIPDEVDVVDDEVDVVVGIEPEASNDVDVEVYDEPEEEPEEIVLSPELLNVMSDIADQEKEREEEEKKEHMMKALNSAFETLEIREEFKKKEQILDQLLKEEDD